MSAKRVTPWVALTLTLGALGGAAFGQSGPPEETTGDWKAVLEVNETKLRLLLHVTKAESGLSASFDSLDQGVLGLPVDSIRRDGARLRLDMSKLGARFDGDWNASTLQCEGKWMQGPVTLAMNWKGAPEGVAAPNLPVSDEDRKYLLEYLKKTGDGVIGAIAHLTPAQWTYKPDPTRWSIAECVEHLVLEEQTLFPAVTQKVVKIPLPDGQARASREQDERAIQFMTDRSQKVSAGESVAPHGKLLTVEQGICAVFQSQRRHRRVGAHYTTGFARVWRRYSHTPLFGCLWILHPGGGSLSPSHRPDGGSQERGGISQTGFWPPLNADPN
jgi:hypothetical protein